MRVPVITPNGVGLSFLFLLLLLDAVPFVCDMALMFDMVHLVLLREEVL